MAKRLTNIQKSEMINNFIDGITIDELAEMFACTKLTIIRNLKKSLDEKKYNFFLKNNKSNLKTLNSSKKSDFKSVDKQLKNNKSEDVYQKSKDHFEQNQEFNAYSNTTFTEIVPLSCEIDNEERKDLSSIPINESDLPNIVYMIVGKNIELKTKPLSDYPDWQFLSQNELSRNTIEIFFDLKIAKRFCNKEQKVIKVPNTNVFKITAPLLVSRGITRIVSPNKLIAL